MDLNSIIDSYLDVLFDYLDSLESADPYTVNIIKITNYQNYYIVNIIVNPPISHLPQLSFPDYPNVFDFQIRLNPNQRNIYLSFRIKESRLTYLPDETLTQILLPLSYEEIKNVCSSGLNDICKSDTFWQQKIYFDYGLKVPLVKSNYEDNNEISLMEERYLNSSILWIMGKLGDGEMYHQPTPLLVTPVSSFGTPTGEANYLSIKSVYADERNPIIMDFDNRIYYLQYSKGIYYTTPIDIPSPVKFVAYEKSTTFVIDKDDNLWSFGTNMMSSYGRLEEGFKSNEYPQLVLKTDKKLDLSDLLLNIKPQNEPFKAKFVSTSGMHTLLIDLEDNLWSFGRDPTAVGNLGYDPSTIDFEIGERSPQHVRTPKQVFLNNEPFKAKFTSCGFGTSFVIDLNDNLWAFGGNYHGMLGLGLKNPRFGFARQMTPAIVKDQSFKIKKISTGDTHNLVIDMEDNVWSFGKNFNGQLGLGDKLDRNVPVKIKNIKAKDVFASYDRSYIIDLDNNVWIFGNISVEEYSFNEITIPTQIKIDNEPFKALQGSIDMHVMMFVAPKYTNANKDR